VKQKKMLFCQIFLAKNVILSDFFGKKPSFAKSIPVVMDVALFGCC